ncbi:MAG: hypothetical protein WCC10_16345 [Tumebacillaceae bacterium]
MNLLVMIFLGVVLAYLLISWKSLRKTNRMTRWFCLGLYALTGGLWLLFFIDTDHQHLATLIERWLNPLVRFIA